MTPRWSHAPLSGAGSAVSGGRLNPPGVEALYLSETVDTALKEFQQGLLLFPRPGMLAGFRVQITDMVDLTDDEVLKNLKIFPGVLECAWKLLRSQKKSVPSWVLAESLMSQGVAGVRVPSAVVPGGVNVVLWHWSAAPNLVSVIDLNNELPNDASSWKV